MPSYPMGLSIPVWAVPTPGYGKASVAHLWVPGDRHSSWKCVCQHMRSADPWALMSPVGLRHCKHCEEWLADRAERFPHLEVE